MLLWGMGGTLSKRHWQGKQDLTIWEAPGEALRGIMIKRPPGSARTASFFPWFLCQRNIHHAGHPESNDDFQVKPKHDPDVVPDDAQPVAVSASFDLIPDLGMNTGHHGVHRRPVIL